MPGLILLVVVAALVFWAIASYNRLVGMRNQMLMEELSTTENKVGFARQFYNDIATKFNTAQQVFPTNIFAGMFGFKPAELFEITVEADREVPMVDLSRKAPTA